MASQLASQLRILAGRGRPEDNRRHVNYQPSFLFEPNVASDMDSQTIYELGVNGFIELRKIDERFAVFETTLFSPLIGRSSFNRETQTKAVVEKVDQSITLFFRVLSPYFLLKAAHKVIEYLIRRYVVQEHNVDAIMECILSFHQTALFAKLLQLLNIAKEPRWVFLRDCQKNGSPLSRDVLVTRASTDSSLLDFMGSMAEESAKIFANSGQHRGAVSLYTVVAIEALSRSGGLADQVLLTLLSKLGSALKFKQCPEYQTSAYMITAKLFAATTLSKELTESLVTKLVKYTSAETTGQAICAALLPILLLAQTKKLVVIPEKALPYLAALTNLTVGLQCAAKSYDIEALLEVLEATVAKNPRGEHEGKLATVVRTFHPVDLGERKRAQEVVGALSDPSSEKRLAALQQLRSLPAEFQKLAYEKCLGDSDYRVLRRLLSEKNLGDVVGHQRLRERLLSVVKECLHSVRINRAGELREKGLKLRDVRHLLVEALVLLTQPQPSSSIDTDADDEAVQLLPHVLEAMMVTEDSLGTAHRLVSAWTKRPSTKFPSLFHGFDAIKSIKEPEPLNVMVIDLLATNFANSSQLLSLGLDILDRSGSLGEEQSVVLLVITKALQKLDDSKALLEAGTRLFNALKRDFSVSTSKPYAVPEVALPAKFDSYPQVQSFALLKLIESLAKEEEVKKLQTRRLVMSIFAHLTSTPSWVGILEAHISTVFNLHFPQDPWTLLLPFCTAAYLSSTCALCPATEPRVISLAATTHSLQMAAVLLAAQPPQAQSQPKGKTPKKNAPAKVNQVPELLLPSLLVALASPSKAVRQASVLALAQLRPHTNSDGQDLIDAILATREGVVSGTTTLRMIFDEFFGNEGSSKSRSGAKKKQGANAFSTLIDFVFTAENAFPGFSYAQWALLTALQGLPSSLFLNAERLQSSQSLLPYNEMGHFSARANQLLCARFDETTITDGTVFTTFKETLTTTSVPFVDYDGFKLGLQKAAVEQVDRRLWELLNQEQQSELLGILVTLFSPTRRRVGLTLPSSEVGLPGAVEKAVKSLNVNTQLLVKQFKLQEFSVGHALGSAALQELILSTTGLLELVQSLVSGTGAMVTQPFLLCEPLFRVIYALSQCTSGKEKKKSDNPERQVSGNTEYPKQLALFALRGLIQLFKKHFEDKKVAGEFRAEMMDLDVLVNCIEPASASEGVSEAERAQTRNEALLVVAAIAGVFPEVVRTAVLPLFARLFTSSKAGASHDNAEMVAKAQLPTQEDEHTFNIIQQTIEAVVPAILVSSTPVQVCELIAKVVEGVEVVTPARGEALLATLHHTLFSASLPSSASALRQSYLDVSISLLLAKTAGVSNDEEVVELSMDRPTKRASKRRGKHNKHKGHTRVVWSDVRAGIWQYPALANSLLSLAAFPPTEQIMVLSRLLSAVETLEEEGKEGGKESKLAKESTKQEETRKKRKQADTRKSAGNGKGGTEDAAQRYGVLKSVFKSPEQGVRWRVLMYRCVARQLMLMVHAAPHSVPQEGLVTNLFESLWRRLGRTHDQVHDALRALRGAKLKAGTTGEALLNVPAVVKAAGTSELGRQSVRQLGLALDHLTATLATTHFVAVVQNLLTHSASPMRRKALGLVSAKAATLAETLAASTSSLTTPTVALPPPESDQDSTEIAAPTDETEKAALLLLSLIPTVEGIVNAAVKEHGEKSKEVEKGTRVAAIGDAALALRTLEALVRAFAPSPTISAKVSLVSLVPLCLSAIQPQLHVDLTCSGMMCLDALCELLGAAVLPHLSAIMPQLLVILQTIIDDAPVVASGSASKRARTSEATGSQGDEDTRENDKETKKTKRKTVQGKKEQTQKEEGDEEKADEKKALDREAVSLSTLSTIQTLVSGVCARFLSPFLPQLLHRLCSPSLPCAPLQVESPVPAPADGSDKKSKKQAQQQGGIEQVVATILRAVAVEVEGRVLLPVIYKAYAAIMDGPSNPPRDQWLVRMVSVVAVALETMPAASILNEYKAIFKFLLGAFDIRHRSPDKVHDVDLVEDAVLSAFVAMVVKLSEIHLKALLLKLVEWIAVPNTTATINIDQNNTEAPGVLEARQAVERNIGRCVVLAKILRGLLSKLRVLVVPLMGYVLDHLTLFMLPPLPSAAANTKKTPGKGKGDKGLEAPFGAARVALWREVADCLRLAFTHDKHSFFAKDHFDKLLPPLVQQVEYVGGIGGGDDDAYTAFVDRSISPAITQAVVLMGNHSLWKDVNRRVFLLTRNGAPLVRHAALSIIHQLFKTLKQQYLVLLPESIPFIAEVMEDNDVMVEARAQSLIAEIESLSGESIQRYLS